MNPEPDVHAASQARLIEFLDADLNLCTTMLDTARIASSEAHRHQAIGNVRRALESIRYLTGRVENAEVSGAISARADEIEAALNSAFS